MFAVHITTWTDRFFESERWQLTLLVLAYGAVLWVTTRFLIAGPPRQFVVEEIETERALLTVLEAEPDPPAAAAVAGIRKLLEQGVDSISMRLPFIERRYTGPFATLSRVLTARRYLHEAQVLRARVFTQDHLALANILSARLRESGSHDCKALALQLDASATAFVRASGAAVAPAGAHLRSCLTEAMRLYWTQEDQGLLDAEDAQRRTLWLVSAGLLLVSALGFSGHRETLLFGALGGFLSPLVRIRQRRPKPNDYGTSWGVLLLNPVAGALTAYAGVLLITFLTDTDVELLGATLAKAGWDHPTNTMSLAVALLFGFSARLFSNLALAAAGAVTPSPDDPDEPPPGPGGGPAGEAEPTEVADERPGSQPSKATGRAPKSGRAEPTPPVRVYEVERVTRKAAARGAQAGWSVGARGSVS